jgi:MraZ protein
MIIGEHHHTLDDKKRVALPAKFRKEIGKKVVITHGFDKCLALFTPQDWRVHLEKLQTLSLGQADSRSLYRFVVGGAMETEVDKAGRILVPDYLKDFAGLGTDVVFVGLESRIELWDKEHWKSYKQNAQKEADLLAERFGKEGFF